MAIAGIALAASTGPTVGQDAAAGEQVFRRLCSPRHEIGPDAKIKLGPPLNGMHEMLVSRYGSRQIPRRHRAVGLRGTRRQATYSGSV
jgi:cytochrome c2